MKKDRYIDHSSARAMANPFGRPLLPPTTRLSQPELAQLREYVRASETYKVHASFFESCAPDFLINLAAAYCLPKREGLDTKIQKISGYTRRRIESLAKTLQDVAVDIRRLNRVELPGGSTFTGLLRELAVVEGTISDMEESFALTDRFDSLPAVLLEYSEAVKQWPHPTYKKLLSKRNWRQFRLVQLSLFIKAMTNKLHYPEIAGLLNAVAEFAGERLNKPFTPDLVGRNINNFRDRNPDVWTRIERLTKIAAAR